MKTCTWKCLTDTDCDTTFSRTQRLKLSNSGYIHGFAYVMLVYLDLRNPRWTAYSLNGRYLLKFHICLLWCILRMSLASMISHGMFEEQHKLLQMMTSSEQGHVFSLSRWPLLPLIGLYMFFTSSISTRWDVTEAVPVLQLVSRIRVVMLMYNDFAYEKHYITENITVPTNLPTQWLRETPYILAKRRPWSI